jgi:ketosteroid isomerase-like protein
MTHWTCSLAVLLMLTGACTVEREQPSHAKPVEAVRAEVESTTAAFHEALRTDNAEALMGYVADDVVMAPPGEAPIRGKEAMRAWYAGFLSQYRTTSLTLADKEVYVGDGWAVEFGSFEWGLAPAAGGESMVDRGTYMQVWRHTPEGAWQFARELWNSAAPAPAP